MLKNNYILILSNFNDSERNNNKNENKKNEDKFLWKIA